jgi:hypothetical protein
MAKGLIIAGKKVAVYSTVGNRSYSPGDIGEFLKRFELYNALRLLGGVSCEVSSKQDAPVNDSVLAYLAMRLIESSNDFRKETMTRADLGKAIDMYWGLPDPIANDHNSDACLLRLGNQFDFQRDIGTFLPRVLAIYKDLWSRVPNVVPITNAIKQLTGLTIEDLIVLCYAYAGQTYNAKGFFRTYPAERLSRPIETEIFSEANQKAFLDWISCDYKTFRQLSEAELEKLRDPSFERFRFNPLITYPAIRPVRNPAPGLRQVYIVPSLRLLVERVTKTLYFDLADYYREPGRKNPFRSSFGYVFQAYVGELLKSTIGTKNVLSERSYGKTGKLSPDWLVLSGNTVILIEAKQSGMYREAKSFGDLQQVRQDLTKSIAKGVKQLVTFEHDLRSGRYAELSDLHAIDDIERVVVTYDRTYFSNSILRRQVSLALAEVGLHLSSEFHWHVMSVDELEQILGIQSVELKDLLGEKRLNSEDDLMDFGDYLGHKYSGMKSHNPYLHRISDEFFFPLQERERQNSPTN